MISCLFRALSLHDRSIKSILVIQPLKSQLRFKSVEEKLGLPTKPKKPINPYFRFMIENRPSVVSKDPKLKSSEINSILGKMWKSLDVADREIYWKEYKNDLNNYYSNEYTKYKSSISVDDKRKIKEMKIAIKERRKALSKQKKIRKLGRPKQPPNRFLRYLTAQNDRKPKEPRHDYAKRLTVRWNELSETEKEKYEAPAEEQAKYRIELLKWERKMLELGHGDVIRSKSRPKPKNVRKPEE